MCLFTSLFCSISVRFVLMNFCCHLKILSFKNIACQIRQQSCVHHILLQNDFFVSHLKIVRASSVLPSSSSYRPCHHHHRTTSAKRSSSIFAALVMQTHLQEKNKKCNRYIHAEKTGKTIGNNCTNVFLFYMLTIIYMKQNECHSCNDH